MVWPRNKLTEQKPRTNMALGGQKKDPHTAQQLRFHIIYDKITKMLDTSIFPSKKKFENWFF